MNMEVLYKIRFHRIVNARIQMVLHLKPLQYYFLLWVSLNERISVEFISTCGTSSTYEYLVTTEKKGVKKIK